MNNDKFQYTQPFKTKCGLPARLLGVLNNNETPLMVAVTFPFGEMPFEYRLDGTTEHGDITVDLSLINYTHEEWKVLKCTDFVHAVVTAELAPIPRGGNPFHYDDSSMGTDLVSGWIMMHAGLDSEKQPCPLHKVTLVNTRSGQRIVVDLSTPKAVQPALKRVYYGQPIGSDTEWVRFDAVPDEVVLATLKLWHDTLGHLALEGMAEADGFSTQADAVYVHRKLAQFSEFVFQA